MVSTSVQLLLLQRTWIRFLALTLEGSQRTLTHVPGDQVSSGLCGYLHIHVHIKPHTGTHTHIDNIFKDEIISVNFPMFLASDYA